jgi:PLP dependent protein
MHPDLIENIQKRNVILVAVSKTKSVEEIMVLYQKGQRVFGENRVQELLSKANLLPKDIEWHLIGHLQKNKVKQIAPFISLVHSVDSYELLEVIQKQANKVNRIIDVLLQFHIATEESKFGLDENEAVEILEKVKQSPLPNIRICGVMGMASFTDDTSQVRNEFRHLKNIFDRLKALYFRGNDAFKEISMGMSGDYEIAIAEGSTMVRLGTILFN